MRLEEMVIRKCYGYSFGDENCCGAGNRERREGEREIKISLINCEGILHRLCLLYFIRFL